MAIIRSVQRGSIALAAAAPSGTFTLPTPVVPANCWVVLNGGVSGSNSAGTFSTACAIVELTGPTTVTASRGATGFTLTVHFTVIEFEAAVVNSIQRGSIDIHEGTTSGTATLNPAPTANAFLDTTGSSATAPFPLINIFYGLSLSGSTITVLLANPVPAGITYSIGYCLVDLTSEVIASTQQIAVTTGPGTIFNAPLSPSLVPANSIILINGTWHQCGSFGASSTLNSFFRSSFTDIGDDVVTPMPQRDREPGREAAPQATFTRNGSAPNVGVLGAYAVEFVASALTDHAVQTGTLPAGTASTVELPSPLGDFGICCPGGYQSLAAANANGASVATYQPNNATIQAQTGVAVQATIAYYAVDFGAGGTPPEPEEAPAQARVMVMA